MHYTLALPLSVLALAAQASAYPAYDLPSIQARELYVPSFGDDLLIQRSIYPSYMIARDAYPDIDELNDLYARGLLSKLENKAKSAVNEVKKDTKEAATSVKKAANTVKTTALKAENKVVKEAAKHPGAWDKAAKVANIGCDVAKVGRFTPAGMALNVGCMAVAPEMSRIANKANGRMKRRWAILRARAVVEMMAREADAEAEAALEFEEFDN